MFIQLPPDPQGAELVVRHRPEERGQPGAAEEPLGATPRSQVGTMLADVD